VNYIEERIADYHSRKFHQLVAAKVPFAEITRALSEIRVDGAREPAKVFTYRMNQYAKEMLA